MARLWWRRSAAILSIIMTVSAGRIEAQSCAGSRHFLEVCDSQHDSVLGATTASVAAVDDGRVGAHSDGSLSAVRARLLLSDAPRLRIDSRTFVDLAAPPGNRATPWALTSQASTGSKRGRKIGGIIGGALLVAAGVALWRAGATYTTQAQRDCQSPTLPASAKIAACRAALDEQPSTPTLLNVSGTMSIIFGGGLLFWGFR